MWKTIARLVRGGQTAERAVVQIQRVYRFNTSMGNKITEAMMCDKYTYPGGINPKLC